MKETAEDLNCSHAPQQGSTNAISQITTALKTVIVKSVNSTALLPKHFIPFHLKTAEGFSEPFNGFSASSLTAVMGSVAHNQIDHILIDIRRHSRILDV
jgi:hypothetical protein